MGFWDHIDELRWHLMRAALAVALFAVVAFLNREFLFDVVILGPLKNDFVTTVWLCQLGQWLSVPSLCMDNSNLEIINITMSGQFMTHMYISGMAGLIVSIPYVLWEVWRFIRPALKEQERRAARGGVIVVSFLFIIGVLFSYYLLVPLTINFLGTYQVSGTVHNQIALSSYISTVASLSLSVGLVFELPVIVWFLARLGIVTASFMRKQRRFMIVVILIIAGIITPPDVFSQIMVFLPLYGLYEISIFIAQKVGK